MVNNCLAFKNGAIDEAKHPDFIDFRDKSDKVNIYNRKYEVAGERAKKAEIKNKEMILEKLEYRDDDPSKRYFMRKRDNLLEIHPPLRY